MTTHSDHRIWQDVYRPNTPAGRVYLKLTVIDDVLIVSYRSLVKLLLDTHAFIWLNTQPSRLSSNVMGLLTSGLHDIYLSIASPWEMQIKSQLGKLSLDVSLSELIDTSAIVITLAC